MAEDCTEQCETTGIIICGGGPTGALLSAMLGRMRVPNVVLERESSITTDPRGIALDEEGIRFIQAIGMYGRIHTRIAQCQDVKFVSGPTTDLHKSAFLRIDFTSSDGGTGHVGVIFHKQPELERAIRDVISESPDSELRSDSLLVSIKEDEDLVQVDYRDKDGTMKKIRASFLVGADGKTGYVRKKYLEPKGISLDVCQGTNYDETWVALNWQMTLPTPQSHPNFPLWKLGYTPEQVYDLFFPPDFRFLCNPSRASVCGRFGPPSERLWRFEFVVQSGEDPDTMASEEETAKIIFPYITHAGGKYGLQSEVSYPRDCIKILRSRPFHFSARSCNKWALGRVILAGDAAHVFPPFGGQGIASGFRDAASLSWRLAHFHREPQADYEEVLRAWYTERKQQFEVSLVQTVRNGELVTNTNPWKAFARDWTLWLLQLLPSMRHRLERGPRGQGMIKYHEGVGLPFIAKLRGGLQNPQVYAKDLVSGKIVFSDDLMFRPSNQGVFQLLILADQLSQAYKALEDVQGLSKRSSGRLREDEATILLHDLDIDNIGETTSPITIARIASAEEFAADPDLCGHRPFPRYYDPFRIRKEVGWKALYVILRPDRYVYAACSTLQELWSAVDTFEAALCLPRDGLGEGRLAKL